MEPRIQYAKTSDGVSIAFWTLGEGMPLVYMPGIPFSHIALEWQGAASRRWYERLAENRRLVRYDGRGSGLSDRDVPEYSHDAFLLDLEAVVERLRLEKFALYGAVHSGPAAITYAARHPERVSHLVLWCAWARASDYFASPQIESFVALRDKDWEIYTETVAHAFLGWSAGRQARQMATFMRASATQAGAKAAHEALEKVDLSDLLSQVRSPTLVLHRREYPFPPLDAAGRLASLIPDAQLVVLEGAAVMPYIGDSDAVLQAIDEFLGEEAAKAPGLATEHVHTILFTDVEGSTALTERLGDAKARSLLREHERMVRQALKSHGGAEVKTMGDGFMASFSSATKALECAIAMQRAFAERNESAAEPIRVRIGLNAGEPIAEDDDLFGTAVNEAARITAAAKGGEILVANVVRELAKGKDFLFADVGERQLKGFDEPVRLYEVRWREVD